MPAPLTITTTRALFRALLTIATRAPSLDPAESETLRDAAALAREPGVVDLEREVARLVAAAREPRPSAPPLFPVCAQCSTELVGRDCPFCDHQGAGAFPAPLYALAAGCGVDTMVPFGPEAWPFTNGFIFAVACGLVYAALRPYLSDGWHYTRAYWHAKRRNARRHRR